MASKNINTELLYKTAHYAKLHFWIIDSQCCANVQIHFGGIFTFTGQMIV